MRKIVQHFANANEIKTRNAINRVCCAIYTHLFFFVACLQECLGGFF